MISGRRHERIVRELERRHSVERAEWAKERASLLDRLMYLNGKPWGGPEEAPPEPEPADIDPLLIEQAADQILGAGDLL